TPSCATRRSTIRTRTGSATPRSTPTAPRRPPPRPARSTSDPPAAPGAVATTPVGTDGRSRPDQNRSANMLHLAANRQVNGIAQPPPTSNRRPCDPFWRRDQPGEHDVGFDTEAFAEVLVAAALGDDDFERDVLQTSPDAFVA